MFGTESGSQNFKDCKRLLGILESLLQHLFSQRLCHRRSSPAREEEKEDPDSSKEVHPNDFVIQ